MVSFPGNTAANHVHYSQRLDSFFLGKSKRRKCICGLSRLADDDCQRILVQRHLAEHPIEEYLAFLRDVYNMM